ncbi:MAG: hypothetical protein OEW12_02320 [Deltaproteobacteria bacterium]|nr:hypothetical protein [Deltaproteobacteria bacterium]
MESIQNHLDRNTKPMETQKLRKSVGWFFSHLTQFSGDWLQLFEEMGGITARPKEQKEGFRKIKRRPTDRVGEKKRAVGGKWP